jgi:hypothetical protein
MRSPLTPLASNDLFARPLIVPHTLAIPVARPGAELVYGFSKAMRRTVELTRRREFIQA